MDRGTSALAGKKLSPVRMGKPAITWTGIRSVRVCSGYSQL